MKIVFVAHGASNGGAGRVSSIICNELVKAGHHVTYLAFFYTQINYKIDERIEYKIISSRYRNRVFNHFYKNFAILHQIQRLEPDIVISFNTNVMAATGLFWNGQVIYSLRNNPNAVNSDFLGRNLRIFLYRKAKAIVFQTPGAMAYFPESIQHKGVVIGNPIQVNLPEWQGIACEKTIITACRLDKQKNVSLLLKAFALISKKYPEYSLTICGDGPLKDSLIAESLELDIGSKTKFLGFCGNVTDLIAKSNIFVLSSDFEGLSNSMLEALAIGIPTVCTDCPPGGAASYIDNGVNGFLVPVGDERKLADTLCKIIDNPDNWEKLSNEAKKIRNKLSNAQLISEWEKLINQ